MGRSMRIRTSPFDVIAISADNSGLPEAIGVQIESQFCCDGRDGKKRNYEKNKETKLHETTRAWGGMLDSHLLVLHSSA
jgi:CO dehydrogenase nickel-insertion accessory protein CooC1